MGKHGAIWRVMTREIGGLPVWVLISTVTLIVVALAFTASAKRAEPAQFVEPIGMDSPTPPAPMPLVVFLGDSYTQGIGGEGITWPDLIGAERGWDVANLGRGGTGYLATAGTEGCGLRHCGTYAETSAEIVGAPRAIFISGGRNDIGNATSKIAEALGTLVDDLKARYPKAIVVVLAPWQDDDAPSQQFSELAPALKATSDEKGAVFVDAGQPLAGMSDLVADDSVHPNPNGYRALAAAVDKAIATIALP
ncbi:SGNH/GDSL hydrolase family protein [Microbacterium sp. NPDC089987]|uniref:SGNH/GDSL hydrolase family protein n=1 Tax=Microbacterium sp. NPDC089987 TaxID=3364202 RepID=UPI003808FD55